MFKVFTCPLNIVSDPKISRLIPYFTDYIYNKQWPMGSRYETSKLCIEAFDLLTLVKTEEDKKGAEDGK